MDIDFSEMEETEESRKNRVENTVAAGKAAQQIRDSLKIKAGDKFIDIANSIESKAKELGCDFAFPANISINDITAHDTASVNDTRVIGEKDVVKIDIGVHKDGYIADGAITYDLSGQYGKLLEANELVLENAIATVKAGRNTADIGKAIEDTVKSKGFRTIENLTGHGLEKYLIHTEPEIPNYASKSGVILNEGDIIAIEPFVTGADNAGHVVEMDRCEIFSIGGFEATRNQDARKMLQQLFKERKTLPFAERHYIKTPMDRLVMRELLRNGSLIAYPVLHERTGGIVSQFEHTVIVEKDAARILF